MNERDSHRAVVEHGVVRIARTVALPTPPPTIRQHPATAPARGAGAMLYRFLDTYTGATLLFVVMFAILTLVGLYTEGHSL